MRPADEPDRGESEHRWPRSVYGVGEEPDPRFTFANERTFLAWVRTALALIAAGVALTAYGEVTQTRSWPALVASLLLIIGGMVSGVGALLGWIRNERAMRLSRPLSGTPLLPVVAAVLVVFGIVALALAL